MDRIKTETIEEMNAPKTRSSNNISETMEYEEGENPKSILIIDDLGVITFF